MPVPGLDESVVAFVPDPMPADLPFSAAVIRVLAEAENALGRLEGATGRLVNPYLIGQPLLRREAILSSRIEGTFTTPEQLALLEAGAPTADDDHRADTLEVLNYIRAMARGLELLKNLPVSLRLIKDLHGVLLLGVRGGKDRPGEIRNVQNYIGGRLDSIKEARFVPPPVAEMNEALRRWESDLHLEPDPLPLLVRVALAHYQFEAIHPFRDGNGRLGRLLIPLLLCERKRLTEPVLYMSAYFDRHQDEYKDGLLRVSTHGDWLGWLTFFLRGAVESAEESLQLATDLLGLRDQYHEAVRTARSSGLLARLIDHLFQQPTLTIAQTAEISDVTPAAAKNNLNKLVDLGIIVEATGRTRGQVFVAKGILAFVGREAGKG
ncbi:MAG: toxin Fic [Acidimicrobiia bacterium]